MFYAIEYGIAFDPSDRDTSGLADPSDLIPAIPYLLGGHLTDEAVVLVGCEGHLPATCTGIDLLSAEADEQIRTTLAELRRLNLDSVVVIAKCSRKRLNAKIESGFFEELSNRIASAGLRLVLFGIEDDGSAWRRYPDLFPRWDEVDVDPEVAIAAMRAGYHAWGRLGVIDALIPLETRRERLAADVDQALGQRRSEPEHGWDLIDRVMAAPGLPSTAEAARLGAVLLDCRVLEHAMSKLICADDPRLDVWFWTARTLGFGPHLATGMAGLAAYRVNAGPRARQAWEFQEDDTPDERTRMLREAVRNRERLGIILAIVEQRMYRCERSCCTGS